MAAGGGAIVSDPEAARRHDLPTGAVPEYKEFVRRVWAWKDSDGTSCIDTPPWMYSIVVTEPSEAIVVSSLVQDIHQIVGYEGRFEVIVLEDGSEFSFADMGALHEFLWNCAQFGATNETARRVCEYVMWSLGFRWV